jgi:hypothetical protein
MAIGLYNTHEIGTAADALLAAAAATAALDIAAAAIGADAAATVRAHSASDAACIAAAAAGARSHSAADGSLASYLAAFDAVCIGHAAPLHPLVSLLTQWEGHERSRAGDQGPRRADKASGSGWGCGDPSGQAGTARL